MEKSLERSFKGRVIPSNCIDFRNLFQFFEEAQIDGKLAPEIGFRNPWCFRFRFLETDQGNQENVKKVLAEMTLQQKKKRLKWKRIEPYFLVNMFPIARPTIISLIP